MMDFHTDNPFDSLCKLALLQPNDDRYYSDPRNPVRKFLSNLADCIHATNALEHERMVAMLFGQKQREAKPAHRRATMPAEARAVADNAAHG